MLVALLLAEGAARLLGPFEGPRFPLETRSAKGLGRYDPLLFWSLEPNAHGDDGLTRTNALGLRGPEVPPVKSPGERRVLVLGESTTFGWDVAEEHTYVARLQRAFDARPAPAPPVRVINAGVPGYTSFQGLQYLRHRGVQLQPDVVIVMFGFNDFLPVAYLDLRMSKEGTLRRGMHDAELFAHRTRAAFRARSWLLERSELARAVAWLRRPRTELAERVAILEDETEPRVPEALRTEVLEQTLALCEAHGARLLIAVPWYRQFRRHLWLQRRFALEHDVPMVDLNRLLAAPDADPELSFLDIVHPSVEGHRQIAEQLFPALDALIR